jgi:hypothetical protein
MPPRIIAVLTVVALLPACGGGGDGGHATATYPTASIEYLQDAGLVVGAPTPPLIPAVAGSVTGDFQISPPLPPGLNIDPDLGNIYGIPTAPAPTTVYTVTAASAEGRIKTTVRFTVRDVIPNISYSPNTWNLTQDVPLAANITPGNRGGVVVTWSIDRILPAGLTFDTNDGTISGTPTAASPQTNYLVMATNSGGTSSTTLTLTVVAASGMGAALRDGAGTYAQDFTGIAGKTAVVQSGSWLTIADRMTGMPLANIELPDGVRWWQLARDGSYVAAATDAHLIVWSRAGSMLFTRRANYGDARVFAAAGELRVAAGPAGSHVIETIAVPGGVARFGVADPGSFVSWTDDGEPRFERVASGADDRG